MIKKEQSLQVVHHDRTRHVGFYYKYRSIDHQHISRTEDIFLKSRLYFPSVLEFNDPFDGKPFVILDGNEQQVATYVRRVSGSRLQQLSRQQRRQRQREMTKVILRKDGIDLEHQRSLLFEVLSSVGVYCLSELNNNILMWSHYANSHKGYCLVFRSQVIRRASGIAQFTASALPIIYSSDYPTINNIVDSDDERLNKTLLTKSDDWKYEKEWRSIDYLDGPGPKDIDPSFLVGVIFGCSISSDDEMILRDLSVRSPSNIKLFRAVMHERQYTLSIRQAD